jgi:hypothetical protein
MKNSNKEKDNTPFIPINNKWDLENEIYAIVKDQVEAMEDDLQCSGEEVAFYNYWKNEKKYKRHILDILLSKYPEFKMEDEEEKTQAIQTIYNEFLSRFASRFYHRTKLLSTNGLISTFVKIKTLGDKKSKPDDCIIEYILKKLEDKPYLKIKECITEAVNNPNFSIIVSESVLKMKTRKGNKTEDKSKLLERYKETIRKRLQNIKPSKYNIQIDYSDNL